MSILLTSIRKARTSQAQLARDLGFNSTQRVNNWIKRGVPPEWAPQLGKLLNVDHRKLCPDFPWPK